MIWKYDSIKKDKIEKNWIQNIESNPIFIDGKIISITADWKIVAHKVENGNLLWDLQSIQMPGRRGMVSFQNKLDKRNYIFLPVGNKVYKIDVSTGKLEKSFGKKGFIESFTLVAPLVYKKKLIIVSPNSISTFDVENGKFIIESVTRTGELKQEWRTKAHGQDHYFDCEVYLLALSKVLGLGQVKRKKDESSGNTENKRKAKRPVQKKGESIW